MRNCAGGSSVGKPQEAAGRETRCRACGDALQPGEGDICWECRLGWGMAHGFDFDSDHTHDYDDCGQKSS